MFKTIEAIFTFFKVEIDEILKFLNSEHLKIKVAKI